MERFIVIGTIFLYLYGSNSVYFQNIVVVIQTRSISKKFETTVICRVTLLNPGQKWEDIR